MDAVQIGKLIFQLRTERGLTQRALAQQLHVGDKAVSKWECGQGCPDVSLLPALSAALGVPVQQLLTGRLNARDTDGGNMKRIQFYACPHCGNVITATGALEAACCGRRLEALVPTEADEAHTPTRTEIEDESYFTFAHEMTKEHHFSFVAWATYDSVTLVKLYPEQEAAVRLPASGRRGTLYAYCTQHGLQRYCPHNSRG